MWVCKLTGPVLITGAGVLGCETARQLASRGQSCVLCDIRSPKPSTLALPNVKFTKLNVTDYAALAALIHENGVESIVHTAAVLSNGMRSNPRLGLEVNLMGTANILEAAREHNLSRVVTVSSATVVYSGFGELGPDPIPEDAALRMISHRPRSLYAMTKVAGEQMGQLYHDLYGVDHVALRLAAVIGGDTLTPSSVPGQLFSTLVTAAKSGKSVKLDPLWEWGGVEEFVDLRDCAAAILAALDVETPQQGIYNVTHPKQWSLSDIVAEVARIYGDFECDVSEDLTTGFAGFPDRRPAPSDLSETEKELSFMCKYDLSDTIKFWWRAANDI